MIRTNTPRRQQGATLLVTLIMLVMLTLFAVTGFNLSSVNLKIVGNFQQKKTTEAMVQQAIEQLMSTVTAFNATPAATNICVGYSGTSEPTTSVTCSVAYGYWIAVDKPKCNYTTAAKGYTKKVGELTPEDTNWEVRASYSDSITKASVGLVQGVAVRMLAGNCPAS